MTVCHTEIDVSHPACYVTCAQYADTRPINPRILDHVSCADVPGEQTPISRTRDGLITTRHSMRCRSYATCLVGLYDLIFENRGICGGRFCECVVVVVADLGG